MQRSLRWLPDIVLLLGAAAIVFGVYLLLGVAIALIMLGIGLVGLAVWIGI